MVSLPDFDPNDPVDANKPDRLNRITAGVYELGSMFKSFTLATASISGAITLNDRIDATSALHVGRFTIHDFHATHRMLTRAGGVHPFLQHRRGAYRPEIRPARASRTTSNASDFFDKTTDGVARDRNADHSEEMVRRHHDHGRLRPRPGRDAASGRRRRCGADQRRQADSSRPSSGGPGKKPTSSRSGGFSRRNQRGHARPVRASTSKRAPASGPRSPAIMSAARPELRKRLIAGRYSATSG